MLHCAQFGMEWTSTLTYMHIALYLYKSSTEQIAVAKHTEDETYESGESNRKKWIMVRKKEKRKMTETSKEKKKTKEYTLSQAIWLHFKWSIQQPIFSYSFKD